jgi:perosamine synthetase|tara:strand:- start:1330 stop:2493 length:1164 start_codon:yes stop_codon:yes gene_type:complete
MSAKDKTLKWKLPLYKIFTDDEDINLITKIIKRGSDWALGPEIEEFENAIKNYIGVDYCVTLNSGTSALHAAFLAYGYGKEDEIIVPSFSFISTANAVLFVDAIPKFTDIEEETFGLDVNAIKNNITKKTKAIVPMDYGGLPCKIFDIQKIANENGLALIEDAAEALGSTIKGKKVGSNADSSIFSFCGNKVLTTGEGGALVTNSKEIFEKVKLIRSHGRFEKNMGYFDDVSMPQYNQVGYNWRMSSITAGLGISQLSKLDKIIKKRQDNAKYISSRIKKYTKIKIPNSPENFEHIYQMYTVRLENKKLRDDLHDYLTTKRIFSKIYFNPIHQTQHYKEKFPTVSKLLPMTEKIANEVLTLPMYPNMTLEEKEYLVESISEFFELNK